MVVLQGKQVMQTLKLNVSGQKSRVEGFTAGPLGKIVTISRKDLGVTWTLHVDKRQYTEQPLTAGSRPDLSNFDLGNLRKEYLGRETVLGYPCAKLRVSMGRMPNGEALVATVWLADSLDLPLRLETMGILQENRSLRIAPQPAGLFEIPVGFTRTGGRGMPSGASVPTAASDVVQETAATSSSAPAWKLNTNYPGGDYRTIDMATSDPTACKAACDRDRPCKAWTLQKPGEPGGMGYCWLKNTVPPATSEDCCISGLKGAGVSTAQSSRYKVELNTNRFGDDFRDFIPSRASADFCAEACAKDSRCRSWTWVKNDLEPPSGHCWLKNRVPEPTPDDCCVSGLRP
ncbi:MAG: DUF4412 domain-containing protein [Acidobacteria bacterium]|nr:DUF4412 domain-containing protein [Acidobacteriota bacterium]